MKRNRGLVKFNFFNNDITCKTLENLAKSLTGHPGSLTEFNLGRNLIKDKGGAALGEALWHNMNLHKINLCDNDLTDASAQIIERNMHTARNLTEFNLQSNLINIRVLELIDASLKKNRREKLAA